MTDQLLRRTRYCGELTAADVGQMVTLCGWVARRRDLGGLIFVDLRDRTGLVQVVFDPETAGDAFAVGQRLRSEYVVAVRGTVAARPEGLANPDLPTGEIEVHVGQAVVFSPAKTPPFYIQAESEADETLRLTYRYLDLRRPDLQSNLIFRHRAVKAVRDYFSDHDFIEVETPVMTRSTPEGARDYLVPSRVQKGRMYALPQSPQLFKQLLMVAGFDKYFQIARCFRDEDLRADRQPEFTQIDVEQSFVDQEDIYRLMEGMMQHLFRVVLGQELELPFPRLTWDEAMERYGSDKPDLRFGLELVDVSDLVAGSGFKVFAATVESGGRVKGICLPGGARLSRKQIEEYAETVKNHGAKGLAWMAPEADGSVRSPIAKFFSEAELAGLIGRLGGKPGDMLFFVADQNDVVSASLGHLRVRLARDLGLVDDSRHQLVWVTEFPWFERDEESGEPVPAHHPFTMPLPGHLELMQTDPLAARARAYDLVMDGYELGSGSVRMYQRDMQEQVFAVMGVAPELARDRFGFLMDAFEYGAPPHAGIALGLDRLLMLMVGAETIREVIAFPKTTSAGCLMTGAPARVDPGQVAALGIKWQEADK
ncbi:MAG: aspartate--tRNA ligase [Bacillota bacterium]